MVATHHAINGQEGLKLAYELQPDLIILDVMMPELDGFEVCSRVREFSDVPVLMLTAKARCQDMQRGFDVGADEYVRKPFKNEELLVRADYLLKQHQNVKKMNPSTKITEYSDGALEINCDLQQVSLNEKEVCLTSTEYRLLEFLVRHPSKTLSVRTLLTEVWGNGYSHDKSLVSFYIHQLRKKLGVGEESHQYIHTQWGEGYSFHPAPKPVDPDIEIKTPEQPEKKERAKKFLPTLRLNWTWVFLISLAIFLSSIAAQRGIPLIFGYDPSPGHTVIDATMTAEGFRYEGLSGVRGHICVDNIGKFSTENLDILNKVQIYGEQKVRYISSPMDLSEHPVLGEGESHCYPYTIVFQLIEEQTASYWAKTVITITNHTGLLPDSQYCPGNEPCPYGPEVTTEFILPSE